MKYILWFILVISIVMLGCASSASYIRGADGGAWISITCKRSQSNCFERAGLECPNGYDVKDNSGQQRQFTYINQQYGYSIPTYNGLLLIKCRTNSVEVLRPITANISDNCYQLSKTIPVVLIENDQGQVIGCKVK